MRDEFVKPPAAEQRSMLSPCVKVCAIEVATGLCSGCGRNRAEIAAWSGMSDAERGRIMTELPLRRRRQRAELDG
jgi:uncharacterized protein